MNLPCLDDWPCEQVATLMFCLSGTKVLLIEKKRGFGSGKINGPGGKLEPHETLAACACRETLEETGITVTDPKSAGVLCFSFKDGFSMRVHPFISTNFRGVATESAEAIPFWQTIATIPYQRMWQDDKYWLPHVLSGGSVSGHFYFDGDQLTHHKFFLSETCNKKKGETKIGHPF